MTTVNQNLQPKAGDIVICTRGSEIGRTAISEGSLKRAIGDKVMITFNASTFRDESVVSCSGGPAYYITVDKLLPTERTDKVNCWKWSDGTARVDNSDYYHMDVQVWEYRSDTDHGTYKAITVDEFYARRMARIPDEVIEFDSVTHIEPGEVYSPFRNTYEFTNQRINHSSPLTPKIDQCGRSILGSYNSFSSIYLSKRTSPNPNGYLYTVSGALQTAFKTDAELKAFLYAYNLTVKPRDGWAPDLIITDGDNTKWQPIEWKAVV
jgi:hypothetical protein